MTLAIHASGLEKRFGHTAALAGLDLEVESGTSLAIVGPNGAGKSTLLRLMAGLARPSAGSLRVAGHDPHRAAARKRVGLIGHETFLYPLLSARENLVFAGRLYGVADPGARADALLEEAGLTPMANRPVGNFSRGTAQRLSIVRGLVHDPQILLLDEPFTGLDRRASERLAERLAALRREARTLVLVTHELRHAVELCDATAVLARGRIVHRGSGGEAGTPALERAYLEASEAP